MKILHCLILLTGIASGLLATGCHKECNCDWDKGIILLTDQRYCACCGGWFIEIEGDTLRAQTLPEPFRTKWGEGPFPMEVRLRWQPDATPCLGDEIEVLEIQRR